MNRHQWNTAVNGPKVPERRGCQVPHWWTTVEPQRTEQCLRIEHNWVRGKGSPSSLPDGVSGNIDLSVWATTYPCPVLVMRDTLLEATPPPSGPRARIRITCDLNE